MQSPSHCSERTKFVGKVSYLEGSNFVGVYQLLFSTCGLVIQKTKGKGGKKGLQKKACYGCILIIYSKMCAIHRYISTRLARQEGPMSKIWCAFLPASEPLCVALNELRKKLSFNFVKILVVSGGKGPITHAKYCAFW